MRKICGLTFGLVLLWAGSAFAFEGHDFQIWNTDAEEFNINKDSKITLEEEFRWVNNADKFSYHHYDIGFFHNVEKWLNVGAGYRQVEELKSGKFKGENELYVTATLFLEKFGFAFDSRNRLEYRHFKYQGDLGRYRNKFTLKFPWRFTEFKFQPYLSDEVLVGFGNGTTELNQNRFYIGFGMDLAKNIKAELYYLLLSTKATGGWSDANILGTKLKVSF